MLNPSSTGKSPRLEAEAWECSQGCVVGCIGCGGRRRKSAAVGLGLKYQESSREEDPGVGACLNDAQQQLSGHGDHELYDTQRILKTANQDTGVSIHSKCGSLQSALPVQHELSRFQLSVFA